VKQELFAKEELLEVKEEGARAALAKEELLETKRETARAARKSKARASASFVEVVDSWVSPVSEDEEVERPMTEKDEVVSPISEADGGLVLGSTMSKAEMDEHQLRASISRVDAEIADVQAMLEQGESEAEAEAAFDPYGGRKRQRQRQAEAKPVQ
jgi:hypothetical protein